MNPMRGGYQQGFQHHRRPQMRVNRNMHINMNMNPRNMVVTKRPRKRNASGAVVQHPQKRQARAGVASADSASIVPENVSDLLNDLSDPDILKLLEVTDEKLSSQTGGAESKPKPAKKKASTALDNALLPELKRIAGELRSTMKAAKDELYWYADRTILVSDSKAKAQTITNSCKLTYLSKRKALKHLPDLNPELHVVRPPPNGCIAMTIPKKIEIDLNDAYCVPFTRELFRRYRHSFILNFDLVSKTSESAGLQSSFSRIDPKKVCIAETLTSYILGNKAFECTGLVKHLEIPSGFEATGQNSTEIMQHHHRHARRKYRIFLVPQYISCEDVSKSDITYTSATMKGYMEDYFKLNTEWSFAHSDTREKMKKDVIGVRFKGFVVPEKELHAWAEKWYQSALAKEKLHLILDLDKTLIRAYSEAQLGNISKLREQVHLTHGIKLEEPKQEDNLPKELTGTDSFPIEFMFNGSKTKLWVKVRPFLKEFLTEAAKDYELTLLSMGVPQYVAKVVEGLDKIYPGVAELIPPSRVMSSSFTVSKAKKGSKDLRMVYPFARFSDRRNAVAIVDDTIDVWDGRENYRELVFPISRYEGYEASEAVPECKKSLRKCLEQLKKLKHAFYENARSIAKSLVGASSEKSKLLQGCRKVKVSELWPVIHHANKSSDDSKADSTEKLKVRAIA